MEVTLTVAQGRTRVRRIRLRSAETIIGRQKGCDVRIPAPEVSRRHCLLSYANGELSVEDLDSSNGTYVNQVRVYGRTPVRAGDRLQIGPVTFIVDYPMSPKNGGPPDAAAGSSATKQAAARPKRKDQDDLPIPLADEPPIASRNQPAAPAPQPAANVIPLQEQAVPEEAVPVEFDESEPLRLPEGENFRDFLSRMEE